MTKAVACLDELEYFVPREDFSLESIRFSAGFVASSELANSKRDKRWEVVTVSMERDSINWAKGKEFHFPNRKRSGGVAGYFLRSPLLN